MKTEQIQKEVENLKEKELMDTIKRRAVKEIENTDKTLNSEFSYMFRVSDNDKVKLNDTDVNNELTKTNNIKVVVNSEVAKERIREVTGIDINKIIEKAEQESPDVAILMKKKTASVLRRLTKQIL